MVRASKGILVECDPSIKAIILKIDQESHNYIVDDLDETTLVINAQMLESLKLRLEEELHDTQMVEDTSDSE